MVDLNFIRAMCLHDDHSNASMGILNGQLIIFENQSKEQDDEVLDYMPIAMLNNGVLIMGLGLLGSEGGGGLCDPNSVF